MRSRGEEETYTREGRTDGDIETAFRSPISSLMWYPYGRAVRHCPTRTTRRALRDQTVHVYQPLATGTTAGAGTPPAVALVQENNVRVDICPTSSAPSNNLVLDDGYGVLIIVEGSIGLDDEGKR